MASEGERDLASACDTGQREQRRRHILKAVAGCKLDLGAAVSAPCTGTEFPGDGRRHKARALLLSLDRN